jgi:hypothetical protein
MNVVCNALPFHMICDWGTKSLPFTVRAFTAVEINHRSAGAPARDQQGQGCDEGDANQGKRLTGVKQARAHTSLPMTSVSHCNLGSEGDRSSDLRNASTLVPSTAIVLSPFTSLRPPTLCCARNAPLSTRRRRQTLPSLEKRIQIRLVDQAGTGIHKAGDGRINIL